MIEIKEKAAVNVEASESSPKRIHTAHFQPELPNKDIKSLLDNVEDEIEENSRNNKHSDSNLTSEIMKRMEKLEN